MARTATFAAAAATAALFWGGTAAECSLPIIRSAAVGGESYHRPDATGILASARGAVLVRVVFHGPLDSKFGLAVCTAIVVARHAIPRAS
jgi:hypothetical protein